MFSKSKKWEIWERQNWPPVGRIVNFFKKFNFVVVVNYLCCAKLIIFWLKINAWLTIVWYKSIFPSNPRSNMVFMGWVKLTLLGEIGKNISFSNNFLFLDVLKNEQQLWDSSFELSYILKIKNHFKNWKLDHKITIYEGKIEMLFKGYVRNYL